MILSSHNMDNQLHSGREDGLKISFYYKIVEFLYIY